MYVLKCIDYLNYKLYSYEYLLKYYGYIHYNSSGIYDLTVKEKRKTA